MVEGFESKDLGLAIKWIHNSELVFNNLVMLHIFRVKNGTVTLKRCCDD